MKTQRNRPGEDVTEWLRFFVSCLANIQKQLLEKLQACKKEEPLSPREKRILVHIQHHAGCTSGSIATKLDIPLPTVKKTLGELISKGQIIKEGKGRATGYSLY
jgi:DNA-binding MarR family transcriptional regulator